MSLALRRIQRHRSPRITPIRLTDVHTRHGLTGTWIAGSSAFYPGYSLMGQTLSEPVTTKESASCVNELFTVGSSCMQGWRINMEDAHTHLLSLPDDPRCAFFAVYDGHGGPKASQFAGINLHKQILQQADYAKGNLPEALRKGFLALDEQMRSDDEMRDDVSGATAVVVLVKDDVIHCANVGDSRAVVSVCGEARPLSYDHKPANEKEAKRILAAGGWVEFNRVNGNLALSRALGDFVFKRNESIPPEEQIVTAYPDVISENITDDHEFIVLACDGIWDVLSNQEVVDFVRERLAEHRDPQTICEELLTRCLAPDAQMGGVGCDNMTVVIVGLLQKQSFEHLVTKCARTSRADQKKEETTNDEDTRQHRKKLLPLSLLLDGWSTYRMIYDECGSL
ncbi:unnamed protein product [Cylicocyclus nassatus]|uniref:protein-serine/threonine phosphatase n=1 Tax=Cylicocyclus nassatus TaxID=53992 RepID=A0AA36GS76_CYLNA|nr:unnamed protein product [Cylicocyclus nassatus]